MPTKLPPVPNYTIEKCYRCSLLRKSMVWFERIAMIFFLLPCALVMLVGSIYVQFRDGQFYPVPTFFPIIFCSIAIVLFITKFNLESDICVNREYLFVDFFFHRTHARLNDIVGVRRIPLFFTDSQPFVILFREGLTPYHRLIGLLYGHSHYRGIYVDGKISNREELEGLVYRYLQ